MTLLLILSGLLIIAGGNAFQLALYNVDVDATVASIGALVLIIGVMQWLFDKNIRNNFFSDVHSQIVGSSRVASSGICDFFPDSKDVDFREQFLSSSTVIVGVNYSAKLIDNSIELLRSRVIQRKRTTLVFINADSEAGSFVEYDYGRGKRMDIAPSISKIKDIARGIDPVGSFITFVEVDTILRYSFIQFDGRIWIVVGTNGLGRRAVPGFFVSSPSPWFDHFEQDITLLLEREVKCRTLTATSQPLLISMAQRLFRTLSRKKPPSSLK